MSGVSPVEPSSAWACCRSNVVDGNSIESLGLTGREEFDITGITAGVASGFAQSRRLAVRARRKDGSAIEFEVSARIETPQEVLYVRHGGFCSTCCASSSANARNTRRFPLESRSRFRQPIMTGR